MGAGRLANDAPAALTGAWAQPRRKRRIVIEERSSHPRKPIPLLLAISGKALSAMACVERLTQRLTSLNPSMHDKRRMETARRAWWSMSRAAAEINFEAYRQTDNSTATVSLQAAWLEESWWCIGASRVEVLCGY